MNYKLAIFDMDGTTLYTLQDLTNAMNIALSRNGLPPRDMEYIRKIVGNGIYSEVEHSVPENTDKVVIERVFQDFLEIYGSHSNDTTKPYDGILDLLQTLRERGIKTAIVSNKADQAVQQLDEIYFKGLINIGAGQKEGVQMKPAPDSVNAVLEQLNIAREEAVYIGDSEVDVQTAINAKMDCIAVTWGYRDENQLIGAKHIVHTVNELQERILGEE